MIGPISKLLVIFEYRLDFELGELGGRQIDAAGGQVIARMAVDGVRQRWFAFGRVGGE